MKVSTSKMFDVVSGREPALQLLDPLAIPDWDAQLAHFPDATVFHTRGWAQVLAETYHHKPLYLALVADPNQQGESATYPAPALAGTLSPSDGERAGVRGTIAPAHSSQSSTSEIRSLLPLMELNSWLTGRRGVSLPFTDLCPPLGSEAGLPRLIKRAAELAVERAWKHLELRGAPARCFDVPTTGTFVGHTLDLTPAPDQLLRGCESSVRRAIRKAEAAGVEVEIGTSLAHVETYYRLHCLTRKRQGVPPQPFRFFANLQRCVLAAGHGFVVIARHQGRPVAGSVFLHFGNHAVYKYGAADLRHQELRGSNLVMWRGIQACRDRGCRTLHFGRTSRDLEGLRRFKMGFGAVEETIEYFRLDPRTHSWAAVTDHPRPWVNRVFGYVPAAPARWIGNALYPHAS